MSRDDTAGNDRFQCDNAKFSSRCAMATGRVEHGWAPARRARTARRVIAAR